VPYTVKCLGATEEKNTLCIKIMRRKTILLQETVIIDSSVDP